MNTISNLIRENIRNIKPYSSARSEFSGNASIFLDANENSLGSPLPNNYHRYPDPKQLKFKLGLENIKGVSTQNQFVGNGSDEAIDVLIRVFCEPNKDNIIVCPPTYDMYETWANINNVAVRKVGLLPNFQLDLEKIPDTIDECTKIIFICSPNNPTGNCFIREDIETILNNFEGIVVVDEAYINFAKQSSFIKELTEYPNLVVMQTMSKAWGLAGLRLGMAFASEEIIHYMNSIKPPYNVSEVAMNLGVEAIENVSLVNQRIQEIVIEREKLLTALKNFSLVKEVFHSDTNFILLRVDNADELYDYLLSKGIVVRNRSKAYLCENCLRITIGTPEENIALLDALKMYSQN